MRKINGNLNPAVLYVAHKLKINSNKRVMDTNIFAIMIFISQGYRKSYNLNIINQAPMALDRWPGFTRN